MPRGQELHVWVLLIQGLIDQPTKSHRRGARAHREPMPKEMVAAYTYFPQEMQGCLN